MRHTNARTIAALGIVATAVLAAVLVMPVSRLLGSDEGHWQAALIMSIPTMLMRDASSQDARES